MTTSDKKMYDIIYSLTEEGHMNKVLAFLERIALDKAHESSDLELPDLSKYWTKISFEIGNIRKLCET